MFQRPVLESNWSSDFATWLDTQLALSGIVTSVLTAICKAQKWGVYYVKILSDKVVLKSPYCVKHMELLSGKKKAYW